MKSDQLDHELDRYIDSFVECSRNTSVIAMACDKGNVAGSHVCLASAVLPSNITVVMCPQVCHGATGID